MSLDENRHRTLSNSSIQTTPRSASTMAPASSRRSSVEGNGEIADQSLVVMVTKVNTMVTMVNIVVTIWGGGGGYV